MVGSASEKGLEPSEKEIKPGARTLRQVWEEESEPRTKGAWEPGLQGGNEGAGPGPSVGGVSI